ncbi:protein ALP1-like [Aphis craccivora]|uniref:Protein ALP1-like n=1 Tax=Aphis craccivora TaxID=307492 RepID=A0A6G0Y9M4_APHCR|nr:protein ALP1-like [Aphis craccivora]
MMFKSKDTDIKEKTASWLVTTVMKAKRKIGVGFGFKHMLIKTCLSAAKKKKNKKTKTPRIIHVPKKGGVLPLIPIFAGLSTLGALTGGVDMMKIPHFIGVFSRDKLPVKIKHRESAVINLDLEIGTGTHWVAYKKIGKQVKYYDSFENLPPPLELQKYFNGYILFELSADNNTLKCSMFCNETVNFTMPNNIGQLLGFKNRKYYANVHHESDTLTEYEMINEYELDNDEIPKARNALVFLVVGMNGYWKLPIILIDSLSGKERSNLLKTAIDFICETGAHLNSVTFDGASVNTTMCISLGAKFDLENNPLWKR